MSGQPVQLGRKPADLGAREKLVRRAKFLAWVGVGWHRVEAAVAIGAGLAASSIGAGLAASSIALIGFGADSLIKSLAGFVSCCGASPLPGPPRRTPSGGPRGSSP